MPTLKELRVRVKSLRSTNKITSAMKLVASSKLKKSQDAQKKNFAYTEKFNEILAAIAGDLNGESDFFTARKTKITRYYIVTSDKGLCGGFNNNLIKFSVKEIQKKKKLNDVEIFTLGKKGFDFFSKHHSDSFKKNILDLANKPVYGHVAPIINDCINDYLNKQVDEVFIIFNTFISVLTQKPTTHRPPACLRAHRPGRRVR